MSEKKITKKRIAELQGAVDKLKEEEANLKARLGEAEMNLWNAQHEVKRNAKPTPAMLAILALIVVTDEAICRNRYSYSFYTHDPNGKTVKVRDSISHGLLEREAITRNENNKDEWRISDHGREVLERWAKKEKAAA